MREFVAGFAAVLVVGLVFVAVLRTTSSTPAPPATRPS